MVTPTDISSQHHNWTAWIGTDEAGKGDYFGSLTVAGIYVNPAICEILYTLGVRDGKQLSDSQVGKLAKEIRRCCGHRVSSFDLEPSRYNESYISFKNKGQNLNHLLASLHARVILNLLNEYADCRHILVDRFAKEEVLTTQLGIALPPTIELMQVPKAESDIAVAAASIIARDVFLQRLDQLSKKYHIQLPKGAFQVIQAGKQFVERYGPKSLRHVAKLHFRTTEAILGDEQQAESTIE